MEKIQGSDLYIITEGERRIYLALGIGNAVAWAVMVI